MIIYLFVSLIVFIVLGVPIVFSIGLSSLSGIILFGSGLTLNFIISKLFAGMDTFVLLAIPFYIMAGELMNRGGLTKSLVEFSSTLVGHLRGGLAHVNILASMFFSGISGSCIADSSAIGSLLIPAMTEQGYDKDFSVAVTASSSVIGPIIPPSIQMVLYSSVTNVSIGAMFMGGILPGILIGFSFMFLAYLICLKRGYKQKDKRASLNEIFKALKHSIWALFLPVVIIGGIISGIFTATEAGVVAVVYSFFVTFIILKSLTLKDLPKIIIDSSVVTTIVMLVMGIGNVFGQLLLRHLFHEKIFVYFNSLMLTPAMIVIIMSLFLLFMGCFIDGAVLIILFAGSFSKIALGLGFDEIHFGVIIVIVSLIGALTPPVGDLLFINCAIAKTSLAEASRIIWPFVLVLYLICILCLYFPGIITYIPNLLMD